MAPVPVVWSDRTRSHDPGQEVWIGVAIPGADVPARVDVIRDALVADGHLLVEAPECPVADLSSVHSPALVEFLATVVPRWEQGGYLEAVGQDKVVAYVFPSEVLSGPIPRHSPSAVHAEAGRFAYDTATLLGAGSWDSVRAAASCALHAADLVAGGERCVYALSRPPGHHATPRGYGGSCYLNNSALAAQRLRDHGIGTVGVVDLDAHHGNGTSAAFYDRDDIRYGSVHVDPAAGWFPHYVGFADERGSGLGLGANLNLPLPEGAGDEAWLGGVASLARWVEEAGCEALVVSLGVDAAVDDPESPLRVTRDGFHAAGTRLGALGLPSVVVQEGGYHLPTLGPLVSAYLAGHAG